ncbi:hypothetical protein ACS0TY_013024 [Phlomoides rotata]
MMRQREMLEFRTPQHPSTGSNNWGGASPMLARNIPKEALDQRYERLNMVRERDQIFPTTIGDEIFSSPAITTIGDEIFSPFKSEGRAPRRGKGLLRRLKWRPHKRSGAVQLGLNSWFPRLNSKKRWPNGWC